MKSYLLRAKLIWRIYRKEGLEALVELAKEMNGLSSEDNMKLTVALIAKYLPEYKIVK